MVVLLGGWVGNATAQSLGTAFTYQGQLTESGQPATGLYDLQICLFDTPSNPVPISCAPDLDDVPVEAGLFTVALDFGASPFIGLQRFLELRVRPGASTGSFTVLSPRQRVRAAPEALRANVASAAPWSGLTGVPAGFADGIDNDSGGTVTSISAGTGLSGGTITGTGTIGIANSGVGLAQIDTTQVQARVSDGCAVGQYLRSVNVDGTVVCGTDAAGGSGTVTSIVAGTGLSGGTITESGTIGIANNGVGAAQINAGQVQRRVTATCALGSYLRGVNVDGSVICADLPVESAVSVVAVVGILDVPRDIHTAIAIGNDRRPVISFYDPNLQLPRVAKCANAACTGSATITTVSDDNGAGEFPSIAVGTDGLPVISFYDSVRRALRVAKCGNPACTGTATITSVDDPANNVGLYTSIAIGDDDRPVISYYDLTAGNLKVAKCANAACTAATAITTVDNSANNVGRYSSIAIDKNGVPMIAYHDATANSLKFARCANAACTGTASITTVDDPANLVGRFTSLAISDEGMPVIAYYDDTAGTLKLARCNSNNCIGSNLITTIDNPANDVGRYASLATGSNGLPVISYHDATAGTLKVAMCGNALCTGAVSITTVDAIGFVGQFSSIAIGADGMPVISYQDLDGALLKVVKCGTRSCQ